MTIRTLLGLFLVLSLSAGAHAQVAPQQPVSKEENEVDPDAVFGDAAAAQAADQAKEAAAGGDAVPESATAIDAEADDWIGDGEGDAPAVKALGAESEPVVPGREIDPDAPGAAAESAAAADAQPASAAAHANTAEGLSIPTVPAGAVSAQPAPSVNDGSPAAVAVDPNITVAPIDPSLPGIPPATASAAATPITQEQTAAVEAELGVTVRGIILKYFADAKLPAPDGVDVAARANLVNDVASTAFRLAGIAVDAHVVAESPSNVTLELRNYVQRELDARGYRFGAQADAGDMRVPATFKLSVEAPAAPQSWLARRGWRPVLTLVAMVLSALMLLFLAIKMIGRLFRGAKAPKTPGGGGGSGRNSRGAPADDPRIPGPSITTLGADPGNGMVPAADAALTTARGPGPVIDDFDRPNEAVLAENARLAAARAEAARVAAVRLDGARIEAARMESARIEAKRVELGRADAQRKSRHSAEGDGGALFESSSARRPAGPAGGAFESSSARRPAGSEGGAVEPSSALRALAGSGGGAVEPSSALRATAGSGGGAVEPSSALRATAGSAGGAIEPSSALRATAGSAGRAFEPSSLGSVGGEVEPCSALRATAGSAGGAIEPSSALRATAGSARGAFEPSSLGSVGGEVEPSSALRATAGAAGGAFEAVSETRASVGVESWRVEAARADAADAEIRRAAKRPAPPAPEPKKAPIARHDSDLAAEFLPDDEHAADFSPALDGESGVMPVSARRAGATGRDRRIPKTKEPVTPELAALLASIEQMPLDQAMVVLATLTEPERDQLFARLNLNSSVRRRVERELEDLRRGAAEPTT